MIKNTILFITILGLTAYAFSLITLYYFQERLLFPGVKLDNSYSFSFTIPFEEKTIDVEGAQLNTLHFKQKDPKGVVFFLHGNGGNLADWTAGVEFYKKVNYDLFIFDYRGYGKSTGTITSEKQLINDTRIAWKTIEAEYADKHKVIYGRSLGTALATQLATEVEHELLVLVSPFSSMTAIAKELYPFVPSSLLRYPLNTEKIIHRAKADIVLMHGDRDTFINISHSEKLKQQLSRPAPLLIIKGANHNDMHNFSSYLTQLANALPK